MFCGIVRSTVLEEMTFMCKLQDLLGDRFEYFESLDSLKKYLLF